jgi:hypothetical protein
MHVASSQRPREDEFEYGRDGMMCCIRPFYPLLWRFCSIRPCGHFSVLDSPINRMQWVGTPRHFFNFHMHFVDYDQYVKNSIFILIIKWLRESADLIIV